MPKAPKELIKEDKDRSEEIADPSVHPNEAEEPVSSAEPETEIVPSPEEEIQRLRLQLDEYKDLFLRKAAEFENFKKRRQQDYSALMTNAHEALILELLPVLDDLDRLLANATFEENGSEATASLLRGAKLIRDKLLDLLQARGLKAIESVGMPFDPELHEALMQQQDSGSEPGMVLQEFARGYRLGEKVIRHAQVVVSG
jgi:molecular chaperone GrpE